MLLLGLWDRGPEVILPAAKGPMRAVGPEAPPLRIEGSALMRDPPREGRSWGSPGMFPPRLVGKRRLQKHPSEGCTNRGKLVEVTWFNHLTWMT